MFVGDRNVGATVGHLFNSRAKATGAPITLAGSPTLAVYKDGGTTESAAGATLVVDFDGRTGLHRAQVDTSADGTFYSAGSRFQVVLVGGTVDGESVSGSVVLEFTLGLLAVVAGYTDTVETVLGQIKAKTDALPTDPADASDVAAAITAATSPLATTAQLNARTILAAEYATATALNTVDDLLDTEVAAIKAVVDAVKAKTDNLPADPADASDLTALIGTVDDFIDTEVAAIKAVTDALAAMISGGAFTAPALANAPTGGAVDFPDWFDNVAANGRIQVDLWSAMGDQLLPDDGGLVAVDATSATLEPAHTTATGSELEVLTDGKMQTAVLGTRLSADPNGARYEIVGGWLHGTPQVGDRYSIGRRALPEWGQFYRELMNRTGPEGKSLNALLSWMAAMLVGKISGALLTGSGTASIKQVDGNAERAAIQYDAQHNRIVITLTPPAPVA